MTDSLRPLLHVGYPKTASSWLQQKLFSHPDNGFWMSLSARALLISELVVCDDYSFDAERSRLVFENERQQNCAAHLVPVWSDETCVGDPLSRLYKGFDVANKLKAVFPHARVLICVREQKEIALSMYREAMISGSPLTLDMFVGTGREPLSYTPILRPDFLDYHYAIGHYQRLFGVDNVLVLALEHLIEDAYGYVGAICQFVETEAPTLPNSERSKVGRKGLSLMVARHLNRLVVENPLTPELSGLSKTVQRVTKVVDRVVPDRVHRRIDQRLRTQIADRYAGRYAASNQKTAKITGLDLARYGYET